MPDSLLDRARQGDRAVLEELLAQQAPAIYRFSLRMRRNTADAEDTLQDTLLAIANHLGEFAGRASFSSWLFALTRSACARRRRGQKNRPSQNLDDVPPLPSARPSPEEHAGQHELTAALTAALDQIPETYREVLLLRDVEGLSASEAAEALGVSVDALKSRLHRARQALREAMHRRFLEIIDLPAVRPEDIEDARFRRHVESLVDELLTTFAERLPSFTSRAEVKKDFLSEALGLGALEDLIADDSISEIMVIDRQTVYVERRGRIEQVPVGFGSDGALRAIIERIIMPLGRRVDESQPLVDARLPDGSRVNVIIPPLALRGPAITIRKFTKTPFSLSKLREFGAMSERMDRFLKRCVQVRKNIVVSGGTGSGKTTLLNALSQEVDSSERIITIEDSAELKLVQPHVVRLETRPANFEGQGAITIRDLVKNALRMRPDRIIVGECRGGEALDMLQAMNTGHDGSLTTLHANNPREAVSRLETLCLMADVELPAAAVRAQIANAVHIIVQQTRFADGSRRITAISEVTGIDDDGEVRLNPLFLFQREHAQAGAAHSARISGTFRSTGYVPTFIEEFYAQGLIKPGEAF